MGAKESNFGCVDKKRKLLMSSNYEYEDIITINNTSFIGMLNEGKEIEDDPFYIDCEINLGYTKICLVFFSLLSILGLISNIYLLAHYVKQIVKGHDTKTVLKKMFLILSIIEIPSSLYWIIDRFSYKDGYKIKEGYSGCHVLSFIYIMIFTFGFTFVNCILMQFIKINADPIEGILRPGRNFIKYLIISAGGALLEALLCQALGIIGKSVRIILFLFLAFCFLLY
ncbi:MAG: hypothetical protein MJ252_14675 [archaeon]|nr:hypothetical protein [archaeon]